MKKFSFYTKAFLILLASFFLIGLSTLGNVRNTGKSVEYTAYEHVTYQMSLKSGETLSSVYVNLGSMYVELGDEFPIGVGVQYTTSASLLSGASWAYFGSHVEVGNIYADKSLAGVNYNWLCLGKGLNVTGVRRIRFAATVDLQLNEIVCLNQDGERIELMPSSYNDSDYSLQEALKGIDAQKSFKSASGGYYTFTQDEARYMTAIDTILGGKTTYENRDYHLAEDYNHLATVLLLPSVAVFGDSVFALRLAPFLATCALLVFAYLLLCELTGKPKYAFAFSVAFFLFAMMITPSRLGTPNATVASALVGSVYFMYKFFKYGISSKRILKDGVNILYAGIFSAFALAMNTLSIIPVVGILTFFGFGIHRQNKANAREREEAQEERDDGETKTKTLAKLNAIHSYQTRVAYGLAIIGFLAATILLLSVGAGVCYTASLKAYGADFGFFRSVWQGIKNSADFSKEILSIRFVFKGYFG